MTLFCPDPPQVWNFTLFFFIFRVRPSLSISKIFTLSPIFLAANISENKTLWFKSLSAINIEKLTALTIAKKVVIRKLLECHSKFTGFSCSCFNFTYWPFILIRNSISPIWSANNSQLEIEDNYAKSPIHHVMTDQDFIIGKKLHNFFFLEYVLSSVFF